MCGRFTNQYTWRELADLYRITEPYIHPISISNRASTSRRCKAASWCGSARKAARTRDERWGLVPSWSKDDKAGAAMINAKAETVAEKPAYRAAFKARPCLVVADGFYEWAKVGPKEKQPYFLNHEGQGALRVRRAVGLVARAGSAQRRNLGWRRSRS